MAVGGYLNEDKFNFEKREGNKACFITVYSKYHYPGFDFPLRFLAIISSRRDLLILVRTRPDTRLPQSRAGGQELYLRSLDHLGRSSEAKDHKKQKKVKCDRLKDQQMDGPKNG